MDAQELGQTINLADAKHQAKLNGFLNDASFLVFRPRWSAALPKNALALEFL